MKILMELYERNCPLRNYSQKYKSENNPWMTKGLQNACKKKNALYRKFIKCRTKETKTKYKKYKNKLTSIIRGQRKDYYSKLLDENRSNMNGTWSVINSVIKSKAGKSAYPNYFVRDDTFLYDMKISANEFNNFFVNVGPNLAKEIPEITVDDYTGNSYVNNINTMFLVGVEEAEVLNLVKNYKGKRSTDCDEFDMLLLKNIIECVIEPFTYICNLSFTSGVFPDHMKTAKVVPLYKTGDRHLFSNCKPVSLLPQFSKILEKLFVTTLDKFIEKHNILNDNQYGFRAKHSTA
ncbi:hypothetical protein LDENG_00270650, partial [Lucifuga dentata]